MARLPGPARPLAALHVLSLGAPPRCGRFWYTAVYDIAILGREWFVWHECSVALLNPLCSRFPEWVREFIIDVDNMILYFLEL